MIAVHVRHADDGHIQRIHPVIKQVGDHAGAGIDEDAVVYGVAGVIVMRGLVPVGGAQNADIVFMHGNASFSKRARKLSPRAFDDTRLQLVAEELVAEINVIIIIVSLQIVQAAVKGFVGHAVRGAGGAETADDLHQPSVMKSNSS